MSNPGYIKKKRSHKAKDLKRNHTAAYLVLDTIAENAKRKSEEGNPLLEVGEAIITAEECGITKHQLPTALKYLESEKLIEVIHRGRKDKNSKLAKRSGIKTESTADSIGIKTGINGTVVKLIDSDIYDINPADDQNQNQNQNGINCHKTPTQIRSNNLGRLEEEYHPSQTLPSKVESIQLLTGTDGMNDGFYLEKANDNSTKLLEIKQKQIKKKHNINYLDSEVVEVYPGDPVKGILPVVMKRVMFLKCLGLPCINNSEEALRIRVKEIQEDPNRTEELKNWPKWVPEWKVFNKKSPIEERLKENMELAKRVQRELPEDKWIQGYRSRDYHDKIKDQKGLLIENQTGHIWKFFPYTEQNFKENVLKFLKERGFPV